MESREEQQTPSPSSTPSKAAAQNKVSDMLMMLTCLLIRCYVQHFIKCHLLIYFKGPVMPKMPQMDLIAELKKRQVKPQVREGKDGVLEDIITGRNRSWRRASKKGQSGRAFCEKRFSNAHFFLALLQI